MDSSSQLKEADFSSKARMTVPKTLTPLPQPSCTFCEVPATLVPTHLKVSDILKLGSLHLPKFLL